jgi:hypothetical protein
LSRVKTKSTLTELKANNGEAFFDIEARLTSLVGSSQVKLNLYTDVVIEVQPTTQVHPVHQIAV